MIRLSRWLTPNTRYERISYSLPDIPTPGRSCTTLILPISRHFSQVIGTNRSIRQLEAIVADILRTPLKGSSRDASSLTNPSSNRQVFLTRSDSSNHVFYVYKASIQAADPIPLLPANSSFSSRLSWLMNKKESKTMHAPTQYNALEY